MLHKIKVCVCVIGISGGIATACTSAQSIKSAQSPDVTGNGGSMDEKQASKNKSLEQKIQNNSKTSLAVQSHENNDDSTNIHRESDDAVQTPDKLDTAPVDLHETCFSDGDTLFTQAFIPSSVLVHHTKMGPQILFNTLNDDVLMIKQISDGTFKNVTLASQAQISCLEALNDGYRIGVIQRDPGQADYRLEILYYDHDDNHNKALDWSAGTRGFVPDPGTRCLLVGHRDVLLSGTRPRGDRAPYHGVFRMGSRSLELFESTTEHVPELLDIVKRQDGNVQILTRQVRRNEANKPEWPHIVYAVKNDRLEPVMDDDFIVKHDEQWIGISKAGCITRENAETSCPKQSLKLSEVYAIAHDHDQDIYLYREKNNAWLARLGTDGTYELAAIPHTWHFFPASKQNHDTWLMTVKDEIKPDTAENLKMVKPDMNCLWGQNSPAQP